MCVASVNRIYCRIPKQESDILCSPNFFLPKNEQANKQNTFGANVSRDCWNYNTWTSHLTGIDMFCDQISDVSQPGFSQKAEPDSKEG